MPPLRTHRTDAALYAIAHLKKQHNQIGNWRLIMYMEAPSSGGFYAFPATLRSGSWETTPHSSAKLPVMSIAQP